MLPAFLLAATAFPAPQILDRVPAWFEARQERFVARGARYGLTLGREGATLSLSGSQRVRIALAGGNPKARLEAIEPLAARTDYFLGARPERWRRDVQHYGRVRYREAYPGVDLVYYASGRQLEYDFVVAPGADPAAIRVRFQGARGVRLEGDGTLTVEAGGSNLRQPPPHAYQEIDGVRVAREARYQVARGGEVRFALGSYDRTKPLVIDPVLVYAGYLGGAGGGVARAVAVDRNGDVWVTGASASPVDRPAGTDPFQSEVKGQRDVFVAKLRVGADGSASLLYWTFLGGSQDDEATAIAVDSNTGSVYLTGWTSSTDFPLAGGSSQSANGGERDAFVVWLKPSDGGKAALWYSSYFGGAAVDVGTGAAVDPRGAVVIVGYTQSTEIAGIGGSSLQQSNRGGLEAFIARFRPGAPQGQSLEYATFLGSGGSDAATCVALDAQGRIWLAGYTTSDNFPVTDGAWQDSPRSLGDAFLARLDLTRPGLDALDYATYLGGGALDVAESLALDADGSVWVAGYTLSTDFPTTPGAYRTTPAGSVDAFVTRLDFSQPRAQALRYSTYLGGSDGDICYGLALLGSGRVAVAGYTMSPDFPVTGSAAQARARSAFPEAFLATLDTAKPGVEALAYSTYFGGAYADVATGLAADAAGNLYVAGYSSSNDLAVTDGSLRQVTASTAVSFVLKVGQ